MKIIYEDKHIIVVEKPQNCPVQRDQTKQHCLLDQVSDYFEFEKGISNPKIGLVHRLDRHTGGIVVFTKTDQATRTLNALFAAHAMTKRYIVRVEGALENARAVLVDYVMSDPKLNKTCIVSHELPGSKMAKLSYSTVQVYQTPNGTLTDLSIRLFTGRQHQIRAQLSNMGHPILGDEKYGSTWPGTAHTSMALWASELKFNAFGMNYSFTSMPPESDIWSIK